MASQSTIEDLPNNSKHDQHYYVNIPHILANIEK